jgi:tRNA-2-methylthio-N6-dimethylallyladenosine synthase
LLEKLPHVDLVIGTQKFHRVADYVDGLVSRKWGRTAQTSSPHLNPLPEVEEDAQPEVRVPVRSAAPIDDLRFAIVEVADELDSQSTIREQQLAPKQATAFVSIMQGCNMHCTFCIVPQTRGPERSRTTEEIVAEVRDLVGRGIKEVTLLGQIVNLYGRHEFPKIDNKSPFVQLLEAVHEVDGLERLRFTSPHPIGFRNDLIEALGRLPKLMPHVHLPLQSGSNRILKAMHRTYTAEKYLDLVERVRRARAGVALTTDIIVGFPGETDSDYEQTRDLVEKIQFDNAFVFRYSRRRDTPAAEMPDQVDERTKEERNHDLLKIVNASARRAGERLVGETIEVLCEGRSKTNPARLMGRTPTSKIVVFEGGNELVGELLDVRIEQATGYTLYGTLVRAARLSCATLAA